MLKIKKDGNSFLGFKTNPVVRILTISDIFILSGLGLMAPIFAVFLTENIESGNLEVVGLASMIFLLTKSLFQIPIARMVDKIQGEKDDFWLMLAGSVVTSFVPLFYLLAKTPTDIYLTQFIYGLAQASTFPSWMAIFTRHVDDHQTGTQWGVYYTLVDLTGALAAAAGGIIAYRFGFLPLFLLVSLFSFIGSFWLLFCYRQIKMPVPFSARLFHYFHCLKKLHPHRG